MEIKVSFGTAYQACCVYWSDLKPVGKFSYFLLVLLEGVALDGHGSPSHN